MLKTSTAITVAAVAREAGVSRTFLYEHPEARAFVDAAVAKAAGRRVDEREASREAADATWKERALNAEQALKDSQVEIMAGRRQIGELLGQVRDLSTPWAEQNVVRIMTEHTALTRRVNELADDNRSLTDRLAAARDNARFADRRIAALEVQLLDEQEVTA